MNLFSPILKLFGVGTLSNPEIGKQVGSSGDISTDSGISVTDERSLKVSAVWACTQYITNSVCSLPIGIYEKTEKGRKELEKHYLVDLLHNRPNALMKPRDFRKAMTLQMCLWSNAYAEIFYSGDRPVALVPLRPGRMTPVITDNGELTYHYAMEQGIRVYSKKSILHLKGMGTDGVVGLERNSYARQALGLSVSADTYAAKQFANGGRSGGGYLMFDKFLTKEQREQAKALYQGMSETAFNKGKLWILEGGVKYQVDSLNPDTLQMIETRKMQLGEIARFFGVPEVLIGAGDSKSAWPASFEQQLLSFLTFTLQDYLDEWETGLKDALLTGKERNTVIIDHDVTGFIKMDSKTKAELQSTWVNNGIKSRNEIRKINNDPEHPDGDELTVQVNLVPIGKLGQQQEPQPVEPPPIKAEQIAYDFKTELRINNLEQQARFVELMPKETETKQEPMQINLTIPPSPPPVVNIDAVINVPEGKQPLVNVTNDVKTPSITNEVKTPEVKVTNNVPVPDVKIDNKIEIPKKDEKKIKFNRDRQGNITSAELDD